MDPATRRTDPSEPADEYADAGRAIASVKQVEQQRSERQAPDLIHK